MKVLETPGALKQLRKTSWNFQQTFKTPLNDLRSFVAAIVLAANPQTASITIDQVVFEPKNLIDLLTRHSLPPRYVKELSVSAASECEVTELLHAAFSDWLDFLFVPSPKPFVIYADHDEYATFYANTRSNLNHVVEALSEAGCERVTDYERRR